jgi:hypothetical protein
MIRNLLVTLLLIVLSVVAVAAWQALQTAPNDVVAETLSILRGYEDLLRDTLGL